MGLCPLPLGPGEKTPRHGESSRGTRAAPHCMTTPICPSDFHSSPGMWRRVLVKPDLEGTGQELRSNQFQEECLHPEAAVLLKARSAGFPHQPLPLPHQADKRKGAASTQSHLQTLPGRAFLTWRVRRAGTMFLARLVRQEDDCEKN